MKQEQPQLRTYPALQLKAELLRVFIGSSQAINILSTIARVGGGVYDFLPNILNNWKCNQGTYSRLDEPFNIRQEEEIVKQYMTPMLLCGKPASVDSRRWFLKSFSNDQTAFSGFTSLVDVVDNEEFGYSDQIKLVSGAAFAEPFVLATLPVSKQEDLKQLTYELSRLDSTQIDDVERILSKADAIAPDIRRRTKGKSPIFFYGIADDLFQLPKNMFERMQWATNLVYTTLIDQTDLIEGNNSRKAFTGSIDFMLCGDDIYVIDIGFPAVGYIADIVATSNVLGIEPEVNIDLIASTFNNDLTVYNNTLSRELGFFNLEKTYLIDQLKSRGLNIKTEEDQLFEVAINQNQLPNTTLDYLSRNQPVREKILKQIEPDLALRNIRLPKSFIMEVDDFFLARNYESTRLGDEDYGLIIKKKDIFSNYRYKGGYYKPLITPLWSRELRKTKGSFLFEQFIPSLTEIDIAGDIKGKRAYEIRMYFVANNREGLR